MTMIVQAIRNRPWTVLGATGLLASVGYRRRQEEQRRLDDSKKKKVLVLPFYRMKIVETKSPISLSSLAGDPLLVPSGGGGGDKTIVIAADELVGLIHEAAQDPSIVGLYGIFGNGGGFSTGGWAHLQEVRNALQVFATSHRQHREPGVETPPQRDRKAMYVYSNTFANSLGSTASMKEYFLASVFTTIHLQPQGDLNLFGLHVTNPFFRDLLQTYGINVHVWKHGAYKNMANQFTHSHFSKEHYENVAGVLLPIHQHVCDSIYTSRHRFLKKFQDKDNFWEMVHSAGSLPAGVAHQIGFVDYLPRLDPLDVLIKNNKDGKTTDGSHSPSTQGQDVTVETKNDRPGGPSSSEEEEDDRAHPAMKPTKEVSPLAEKWKFETDLDHFTADAKIDVVAYGRQKAIERQREAKDWKVFETLERMSESNVVTRQILSLMGYSAPFYNIPQEKFSKEKASGLKEKIAVIKINGTIGEKTARKVERALRKIKEQKDVKSVVLRVDSPGGSIQACETIYEEIQDLPQKVVVSFGNVSASGGYYISANAERIFASPTTVTGSIGVVMLRMDFRGLAKRYGITFDSIPTSGLSGSYDPFYPINHQMNENFANAADRAYYRFKSLVSTGRDLDMNAVEAVAKGRVWTGEQAHEIGLVDELGGLDRAIAYAQRNYTTSGHAQVVHWPPKKSLWESLTKSTIDGDDNDEDMDFLPNVWQGALVRYLRASTFSNNSITQQIQDPSLAAGKITLEGNLPSFPLVTSGVMLTADENIAIRCLLEESGLPHAELVGRIPGGSSWD